MISPQKFSKTLGNNKLKFGVSVKELFICSLLPSISNFLDHEAFISFVLFLGSITALAVKNILLEPSYIKNTIEKKPYLDWERISIND